MVAESKTFDRRMARFPSYSRANFTPDNFKELVKSTAKQVKRIRAVEPKAEALAAVGFSGLMLMGAVAARLHMPQIAVRKTEQEAVSAHSSFLACGQLGVAGYIILDDLIASGDTVKTCVRHIDMEWERCVDGQVNYYGHARKELPMAPPSPVAVLLYDDGDWNRERLFGFNHERDVASRKGTTLMLPVFSAWAETLSFDST